MKLTLQTETITAPHTQAQRSVSTIMLWVILALSPACLYGLSIFGWPALNTVLLTVASCIFFETLCLKLRGETLSSNLLDNSALLTALLLAMSLPPWSPWWLSVLAGFIAIVIGKQVFGGLGHNIFNPAMLARVSLLVAFPVEMTTWVTPVMTPSPSFLEGLKITFLGIPDIDAISSPTILSHIKTELSRGEVLPTILNNANLTHYSYGFQTGSLGETSAILIFLGGLVLLYKRIITWHIPFSLLITTLIFSGLLHLYDADQYASPIIHLLSGGLMLGAFFIATDMVTSPATGTGQILFGIGCGVMIVLIRSFGGFPEGVGFAVLLMNAATPLIDHYTRPRIYGRNRAGQPFDIPENE